MGLLQQDKLTLIQEPVYRPTHRSQMAFNFPDPLESFVTDGRLLTRPLRHYGLPEILTVDLEQLAQTLVARLTMIFLHDHRIRTRYGGSIATSTQQITSDTEMLVNYLVGQTYNRLRLVLERKHRQARVARMNTRCPLPGNLEFPAWLSSTLSSIGPFRVTDGPRDNLVVYATTAATMQNYGRANVITFTEGQYYRIITCLREIGVRMAPFDFVGETGSCYPTITPQIRDNVWSALGQLHQSHYENEDLPRIALVTSILGTTPFEDVGMRVGYVDNEATITALTAVAAPAGIPAGQTAASAGQPVGINYRVNYYGIQPAVAAQGDQPARAAGIYVLGRGTERIYHCQLVHDISSVEILELLRFRVMRTA